MKMENINDCKKGYKTIQEINDKYNAIGECEKCIHNTYSNGLIICDYTIIREGE